MPSYACRDDATFSLYPVPPGKTRRELYCPRCRAERCLFTRLPPAQRLKTADRWVPVKVFSEQVGIRADKLYQLIREGMPAEKRPWNGSRRMVLGVIPKWARLWLRDRGRLE